MADDPKAAANATSQVADTMATMARGAAEAQKAMMAEMSKLFGDMRVPSVDTTALMAAHRRNMETLAAANRVAMEGAQTVAKRHMEIVQHGMSVLNDQVRELASAESPQSKAARQAELLKQSYESAVGNLRELSDLIQRSNAEAVELLNRRFTEAMDELKTLIAKDGAP